MDVKLRMLAEDVASEVVKKLSENVKTLGDKTEDSGKKADKSSKDFKLFGLSASDLMSVLEMSGKVISAVFGAASDSMQRLAEGGDKNAQVIVGSFGAMQKGADSITGAIAKDLAPIMGFLANKVVSLTSEISKWIDENDIAKKVVLGVVDVMTISLQVIGFLVKAHEEFRIGMRYTGEVIYEWIIKPIEKATNVGKKLGEWLEDVKYALYLEDGVVKGLGESFDQLGKSMGNPSFKDPESWHATSSAIDGALESVKGFRAELEKASEGKADESFIAVDKEAIKAAADAKKEALDKERAMSAANYQLQLTEAGDNAQRKLEITRNHLNDVVRLYGEASPEVLAAAGEIFKAEEEASKESKKAVHDINVAFFEASKKMNEEEMSTLQSRIESLQEQGYTEEEIRQMSIDMINLELEAKKVAEEEEKTLAEKKRERYEEQKTQLEDQLAGIDNLLLTDEEATERRIELLRKVAKASESSTELQIDAGKKLAAEEKKLSQIHIGEMQGRMQKLTSMFSTGLNAMLNEHKSFAQAAIGALTQHAKGMIDVTSGQVGQQLALVSKMTEGEKQAYKEQAMSAKGSIPAKIAAALSSLGPLAPVAAAALTAVMFALVDRLSGAFMKFESGGPIPGYGTGDIRPILAEPGEIMIRKSVSEKPQSREFLLDYNETGDFAGAASRSGIVRGAMSGGGGSSNINLHLTLEIKGGVLMPRAAAAEVGPILAEVLNEHTRSNGGNLWSTGLLRTSRKKTGTTTQTAV